jgi:hypothetical protein
MPDFEVRFYEQVWQTSTVNVAAASPQIAIVKARQYWHNGYANTEIADAEGGECYANIDLKDEDGNHIEEVAYDIEVSTGMHDLSDMRLMEEVSNSRFSRSDPDTGNRFSCLISQYHEQNHARYANETAAYRSL